MQDVALKPFEICIDGNPVSRPRFREGAVANNRAALEVFGVLAVLRIP